MIIKTKIFGLRNGRYKNLSELAQAMGISVSQVYRVQEGKRHINQKFIIGAMRAFPECKLDDLFYLAPKVPTVTNSCQDSTQGQVARGSPQQMLERFISAIDEYGQHLQSHTSVLKSLRQASQELKNNARKVNRMLSYLMRSPNR